MLRDKIIALIVVGVFSLGSASGHTSYISWVQPFYSFIATVVPWTAHGCYMSTCKQGLVAGLTAYAPNAINYHFTENAAPSFLRALERPFEAMHRKEAWGEGYPFLVSSVELYEQIGQRSQRVASDQTIRGHDLFSEILPEVKQLAEVTRALLKQGEFDEAARKLVLGFGRFFHGYGLFLDADHKEVVAWFKDEWFDDADWPGCNDPEFRKNLVSRFAWYFDRHSPEMSKSDRKKLEQYFEVIINIWTGRLQCKSYQRLDWPCKYENLTGCY